MMTKEWIHQGVLITRKSYAPKRNLQSAYSKSGRSKTKGQSPELETPIPLLIVHTLSRNFKIDII